MKLKTILLSGLFLIPFFSCEKSEEVNSVDIKTTLVAEISVISNSGTAVDLKSEHEVQNFAFAGSGIFCLAQNEEMGKPFCIIENIKPDSGCKLVFNGTNTVGNISSMLLKWGVKDFNETDFIMQNEVDLTSLPKNVNNGNLEIDLSGIIDPLVTCIDCNKGCLYRVEITGSADFALPENISLIVQVKAERKSYTTGFTLF